MPRALADYGRLELRLRPEDKATLTRAASIKRLDLRSYILGAALPKAEADITEAERLTLSEPDSLRVLALLENPPKANDLLLRAARAGWMTRPFRSSCPSPSPLTRSSAEAKSTYGDSGAVVGRGLTSPKPIVNDPALKSPSPRIPAPR